MKRSLVAAVLVCLLTGWIGDSAAQPSPVPSCPQAANGHGFMGECAPGTLGLSFPPASAPAGVPFEDRSDNNPCVCGQQIRASGAAGLVVKANQGDLVDPTAVSQIASARGAGLAVGLYDFDAFYTVGEVQMLVARARAAGLTPNGRNEFPLTLDVEWGAFSYSGLLAQIGYLHSLGWRVDIYTGSWFWSPHAGCRWAGVDAWLSGYPFAQPVCGLPSSLFRLHQYTDQPLDLDVFLGSRAAFEAFVNNAPTPKPALVCFGAHASKARACRPILAGEASDLRAATASRRALSVADRALRVNRCVRPYRRGVCVRNGHNASVLAQRAQFFTTAAHRLVKEHS